jgi:hypothetical protein
MVLRPQAISLFKYRRQTIHQCVRTSRSPILIKKKSAIVTILATERQPYFHIIRNSELKLTVTVANRWLGNVATLIQRHVKDANKLKSPS